MICDNTDRNIRLIILLIFYTGDLTHSRAQCQYRVHVKNRIHILYCRRQALQSHTGIDILLHKFRVIPLAVIVELGKYVVPDLHITVTVTTYRTARLTASIFLSTVIINLRAGTAGAGTMLPKVILFAEAEDPLRWDTDLFVPDLKSFLIILIDRRIEPVCIQPHYFRKELPAPGDSFMFKIIPEGEISQHLEKGAMSCRLAYILQISCTDTFLAGGDTPSRRYLLSRKIGF